MLVRRQQLTIQAFTMLLELIQMVAHLITVSMYMNFLISVASCVDATQIVLSKVEVTASPEYRVISLNGGGSDLMV